MLEGKKNIFFKKTNILVFFLRYLCEYIYYQSLFIDSKRTIFIHIPDLDKNYTIENLAETIQLIIYEALRCVDPLPLLNQNGNYYINSNTNSNKNEKLNLGMKL